MYSYEIDHRTGLVENFQSVQSQENHNPIRITPEDMDARCDEWLVKAMEVEKDDPRSAQSYYKNAENCMDQAKKMRKTRERRIGQG